MVRGVIVVVVLVAGLVGQRPAEALERGQEEQADPVFVGSGDIASCASSGDEATAALLDTISGTVWTAGDNVYDTGTAAEFTNCYEPSWGRHKARTRPTPGNHDYGTPGATGYYGYFGAAAG
jgi:acid phosphatase type 7